jgi:hypothetical protein
MNAIYAHLRQACRWHTEEHAMRRPATASFLVGGAAVALPLILSAKGVGLPAGLAMSLGALSVSGVERHGGVRSSLRGPALAMLAALLATLVSAAVAGHGWSSELTVLLIVSSSALMIRYNRTVAVATIRFMLFLVIFSNALATARDPLRLAFVVGLGVIWAGLLGMLVNLLFRRKPLGRELGKMPQSRDATLLQHLRRMQRELKQRSTWDFPLRLLIGLSLALYFRVVFREHHFAWISVTVALLTPRQFEIWPVRATQRALGTLLGVLAAALLLLFHIAGIALLAVVFLLGGLRKWLEEKSYLAYSATMAPLVLLLLTASAGTDSGLLEDRVLSTLIGVLVVLACNQFARRTTMAGAGQVA